MSDVQYNYRPDIDGLRAVAVLLVVMFHASPSRVSGGYVGVDVFFVISGYLITGILQRELEGQNFSIAKFYVRRARRIFPSLLLVLVASLAVGSRVLFPDEFSKAGEQAGAASIFISNIWLWMQSGYFDRGADENPFLHMWSLGVEEQFYIVWPLFLALCWRMWPRSLVPHLLLCAISVVVAEALLSIDASGAFYLPVSRFWELGLGGVIAISEAYPESSALLQFIRRFRNLASPTGMVLIIIAASFYEKNTRFPGLAATLPVLGAGLIIASGAESPINSRVLGGRVLVFIGLISYPWYLWHWPVLAYANIIEYGKPALLTRLAAVGGSFVLAYGTYRLLELPLKRVPQRMAYALALAGGLACVGLFGLSIGRAFNDVEVVDSLKKGDLVEPAFLSKSDPACLARLGLDPIYGSELNCQAAGGHPEILILGDSHAMALYSSVRGDPKYALLAAKLCLPFREYTPVGPWENIATKRCDFLVDAAVDLIRKGSVRNVILSTRGAFYISGGGFGVEASDKLLTGWRLVSNASRKFSDNSLETFISQYHRTIDEIQRGGVKVGFIVDVPELGFDPRVCIARNWARKSVPESSCGVLLSDVAERNKTYWHAASELKKLSDSLDVIDTRDVICGSRFCSALQNGRFMYFDDDHLSVYGSSIVIGRVLH